MGLLRKLALASGVVVALIAAPVIWIETSCVQPRVATSDAVAILPPEHRRNLVDTWLTYPEWSIVHAYEDFARVGRERGEASFAYTDAVTGFWSNLCKIYGLASTRGDITGDMRAMLHIIGLSFSAEMAVKGAWETTIGRLTEWWRGSAPTAEDRFAAEINDRYAAFLRQTPWYEFPFGETLARFWRETPFQTGSIVRSIERRIALSLEYGVKAGYARLIGLAAGLAPAKLTLRSVIDGLDDTDLAADPRITLIERRPDGLSVIETPRYRAFTEILQGLAERRRSIVEIAGNREIFVTLIAPISTPAIPETQLVLSLPLQSRAAFERRGITVSTARLSGLLTELKVGTVELEHIYDY